MSPSTDRQAEPTPAPEGIGHHAPLVAAAPPTLGGEDKSSYIPVRVACRAAHPDRRNPGKRATSCGTLLGYLPGPIRFVGLVERAPDVPDGRIYVSCPRRACSQWNAFEVLPPPSLPEIVHAEHGLHP